MPVHDWSRVDSGIFHDFHQTWIIAIRNKLNELLPSDYYALAEQVAQGHIPDVVTLERRSGDDSESTVYESTAYESSAIQSHEKPSMLAVLETPPKVEFVHDSEQSEYASKASRVAIRHRSGDQVIGYIEIVSPGNKQSESAIRAFTCKLDETLQRGCHALIVDVHKPTPRDPRGIHARFWEEYHSNVDVPGVSLEKLLGMSAYRAAWTTVAYFQPFAIGDLLIDMPAFLTPNAYINVPLESTYQEAWHAVPRRWKAVIESPLK